MKTYNTCLPGTCTFGTDIVLAMHASEVLDADYDTGTVDCLEATTGTWQKPGTEHTLTVNGASLGSWCIEDAVELRSGDRTLKWDPATESFYHLGYVTYKLRRAGYQKARATICRDLCPGVYPPRFCTYEVYNALDTILNNRVAASQAAIGVAWTAYVASPTAETQAAYDAARAAQAALMADRFNQMNGRQKVSSPGEIVTTICGWVGLAVTGTEGLSYMPDEYSPVSKPIITAVREIASWSGKSVLLDRSGTLVIFDWTAVFTGSNTPYPAAILEEEYHDALYPVTHVTVVGSQLSPLAHEGHYDYTTSPPTWVPWDPTAQTSDPGGSTAVEETQWMMTTGDYPVEERIEIRDYSITPELARNVALERLARGVLEAGLVTRRGPAEGCETICPVTYPVFAVTRTLQWTGAQYIYEISIDAPLASMWTAGSTTEGDDPNATIPTPIDPPPHIFDPHTSNHSDPVMNNTDYAVDPRRPFA
jgi:hypothetical protein